MKLLKPLLTCATISIALFTSACSESENLLPPIQPPAITIETQDAQPTQYAQPTQVAPLPIDSDYGTTAEQFCQAVGAVDINGTDNFTAAVDLFMATIMLFDAPAELTALSDALYDALLAVDPGAPGAQAAVTNAVNALSAACAAAGTPIWR